MKQGASVISHRAAAIALAKRFIGMAEHISEERCLDVCVTVSDAIKSGYAKHAQEKEQLEHMSTMATDQLIELVFKEQPSTSAAVVKKRVRVEEEEEEEEEEPRIPVWTPATHYLITEIVQCKHYDGKLALILFARKMGTGVSNPIQFIATNTEIEELDRLDVSVDYIKSNRKRILEPFIVYFSKHPIDDNVSLFTGTAWGRAFMKELRERTRKDYFVCHNPDCKVEFRWQDAGYDSRPSFLHAKVYCKDCK